MGFFSGLKDASPMGQFRYLDPGFYTVKIQSCEIGESSKRETFMAAQGEIVESNNPQFIPGQTVSCFYQKITGVYANVYLGNIKSFLTAAMHRDPNSISEIDADWVTSVEQPLVGQHIQIDVTLKTLGGRQGQPEKEWPISKYIDVGGQALYPPQSGQSMPHQQYQQGYLPQSGQSMPHQQQQQQPQGYQQHQQHQQQSQGYQQHQQQPQGYQQHQQQPQQAFGNQSQNQQGGAFQGQQYNK